MEISFGKHKGKTVESLVLKHADYVRWILEQPNPNNQLSNIKLLINQLITTFNVKPMVKKCVGIDCNNQAVCFSTYQGNPESLYFWCESCDPYSYGATKGKLIISKTYIEVLNYIEDPEGCKYIIKEIAIAKGLPKRSTKDHITAFFANKG